jgi:hypothetical protein
MLIERAGIAQESRTDVSSCSVGGFRIIDQKTYDAMVTAFRAKPGNASYAAIQAGCDRRMAKRGWQLGWDMPARGIKLEAIQAVLAREQMEARSRVLDAAAAELNREEEIRDKAREEAIEARVNTGVLLRGANAVQSSLMVTLGRLAPAVVKVAESLAASPTALEALPIMQRMRILRDFTRAVALFQQSTREHQASVRLHFGQPETIIGIHSEQMSDEELVRDIEAAYEEAMTIKGQLPDMQTNGPPKQH